MSINRGRNVSNWSQTSYWSQTYWPDTSDRSKSTSWATGKKVPSMTCKMTWDYVCTDSAVVVGGGGGYVTTVVDVDGLSMVS
uniref:Uncharacterized protein n=1 Tax=Magallana gigas TaxID=29159 RepID=K1QXE5_MAGGI